MQKSVVRRVLLIIGPVTCISTPTMTPVLVSVKHEDERLLKQYQRKSKFFVIKYRYLHLIVSQFLLSVFLP